MSVIKMYKDKFNNEDFISVSYESIINDFITSRRLSGYDEIGYENIKYFLEDFYFYLNNLRGSHEIISEDVEICLYSEFKTQILVIKQKRNNGHVLLINVKTGNFNIINKSSFGNLSIDDKVLCKGSKDECEQFQYDYDFECCELSIASGEPKKNFIN